MTCARAADNLLLDRMPEFHMTKPLSPKSSSDEKAALPGIGDDELVETILTTSRAIVGIAARSLGSDGEDISLPQFRALVLLSTEGPLRPADLAGALSVDPSTVTRLCDRLVAKRLISRRRDKEDRREVRLHLTIGGRRLLDAVTDHRRSDIARILQQVPREHYQKVHFAFSLFGQAAGETPDVEST